MQIDTKLCAPCIGIEDIDVPDFFSGGGGQTDPLEFRNFFSGGGSRGSRGSTGGKSGFGGGRVS